MSKVSYVNGDNCWNWPTSEVINVNDYKHQKYKTLTAKIVESDQRQKWEFLTVTNLKSNLDIFGDTAFRRKFTAVLLVSFGTSFVGIMPHLS